MKDEVAGTVCTGQLCSTYIVHSTYKSYLSYSSSIYTMAPGVDSAPNRNEYQEYFLDVKAAGASG
jgi:hypothetical protein